MLSPFQAPSASFIQGQCRHASLEASAALVMLLAWRSGVLVCQAPVWTFVVTFLWTFLLSDQPLLGWSGRLYHAWHVYICLPGLWITVTSVWSTACASLLCSTLSYFHLIFLKKTPHHTSKQTNQMPSEQKCHGEASSTNALGHTLL